MDMQVQPAGEHPEHQAQQAFKAARLKPTLARLAVWHLLYGARQPVDTYEIQRGVWAEHADIPINTLYMALRHLENKGLVRRLHLEGESRAHYVLAGREQFCLCIVCGANRKPLWVNDGAVREAIEALCARHGLALHDYQLHVQAGDGSGTLGEECLPVQASELASR